MECSNNFDFRINSQPLLTDVCRRNIAYSATSHMHALRMSVVILFLVGFFHIPIALPFRPKMVNGTRPFLKLIHPSQPDCQSKMLPFMMWQMLTKSSESNLDLSAFHRNISR